MGFKTVLFSRGNAAAEAAANSEFVGGDSQFLDTSAPAMTADATAAAPATPDSDGDAPLRLRDALRRRVNADAGVTAADAGAGFKLPLIGHLPAQRQLSLLSTALAVSLAISGGFVALNSRNSASTSTQTQIASDALMHSQRIGKAAPNAVAGNAEAFRELEESRNELNKDLQLMASGGHYQGRNIGGPNAAIAPVLAQARKKWAPTYQSATTILMLQNDLKWVDKTLQTLNGLSPELLTETEAISNLKVQRGGTPRELAAIGKLTMLTQRMSRSAGQFIAGGGGSSETAFLLGRDTTVFRNTIDAFLNGSDTLGVAATRDPELREKFTTLKARFEEYQKQVSSILDRLDKFGAAKTAEQLIFNQNEELRQSLVTLQQAYRGEQDSLDSTFWLMVGGGDRPRAAAGFAEPHARRGTPAPGSRCHAPAIAAPGGGSQGHERPESGGDSAPDERAAGSGGRRLDGAGHGVRGHHRRHRRLGQLHGRGAARAGGPRHQHRRAGHARIRPRAEHLQRFAAGVAAAVARNPGRQRHRRQDGQRDHRGVQVGQRIGRRGAPVGCGGAPGFDGGGKRHQGHERNPRTNPGNLQAHQAPGRIVAGDRRDHRTDFGHHRADQRAGAERGDPGRVGRRGGPRLLGRGRGGAAAGGTFGRSGQADRRAGAHDSDRHPRRRRGDGKIDAGRGRGGAPVRRRRLGAERHLAGVEPPGRTDFRDLAGDRHAGHVGQRRGAEHPAHFVGDRTDPERHPANRAIDSPAVGTGAGTEKFGVALPRRALNRALH